MGEHSNHNHCPITQAITEFKDEVKKAGSLIDEMIKGLDEGYDKIENMVTKIRKQGDDVKDKIDMLYNEVEQKMKQQRVAMKQQVTEAVKQKEKNLITQNMAVRQVRSDAVSLKEMKDDLEKKSNQEALSTAVAQKKDEIDKCLLTLKDGHVKINLEPEEIDNIELFSLKSVFPQFCNLSVGSISTNSKFLVPTEVYLNDKATVTLLTKNSEGHCCSEGGNKVSMQLETSKGKINTLCVEDNRDGSYVASL